jgi:hypothetical protein
MLELSTVGVALADGGKAASQSSNWKISSGLDIAFETFVKGSTQDSSQMGEK